MTALHAKIDVVEGELPEPLVGAGANLAKRTFVVLTLMRDDGTTGVGEASPLPGYSRDDLSDVVEELHALTQHAIEVDALGTPLEVLSGAFDQHPLTNPSARFALETAILDWLGQNRGLPVHRVVGGDAEREPIPIADLVHEPDPSRWPAELDRLVQAGATHVKFKVGSDFSAEMAALLNVREAHPSLSIRLDGNGKLSPDAVRAHASTLETLGAELFEEPVPSDRWGDVLDLPLPFALDETLRDAALARRWLETEEFSAVVLKPTLLGGFRACLDWAETAARAGADSLVSHTFDGPVARAAAAELALVLQCRLAAGLGSHAALALWPPCRTSAIRGRWLADHDAFGLGLEFEDEPDA